MSPSVRTTIIALSLMLAAAMMGCASDPETQPTQPPPAETTQQPPSEEPQESGELNLFEEITNESYSEWQPAPRYEVKQAARGPHGEEVQIFLNPTAERALADSSGEWPVGSIVAKDIYQGGELFQVAAMKKVDEGWYWGEWSAQGVPVTEGLAIQPCEGCHSDGTDGTLAVTLE
ncbi:MAG TPA: hypothetical protein VLA05_01595 [Coriobacteriia bacterium]|nr:hypothetical protein [Coriobacteriia bacterium]